MRTTTTLALALLLASPSWAAGFSFAGELRDGDRALDGTIDLELALYADADGGTPLWGETQGGVVVVAGVFALDVGSATPLPPELAAHSSLYLQLTVDDDELAPRVALAALPLVGRARVAANGAAADDALAVNGIDGSDLATLAALTTVGDAAIVWGNLTNLPAGVADGDHGTPFSVGGGLELAGGALSIADGALGTSSFAAGSIAAADLAFTISTAKLADGAVTGASVADGSLTGADVATDALTASRFVGTVRLYRVAQVGCAEPLGMLMTEATCTPAQTCAGRSFYSCTTGGCETHEPLHNCTNTAVGSLLTQ